MNLRPYQQEAIESVYRWFAENDGNPLIVLPTGSGKSVVQAELIRDICTQAPGERIVCLTHVRELIAQNHAALLRLWPEAPAGIYSAGIGRREHDAQVLFAGIQSVYAKAEKVQWADLIIIDECHLIPAKGFGMYRQFLTALESMNPKVKLIGLTATPFRTDTGRLNTGEDRMFHGIAYDAEVATLIDQGYLSKVTAKATHSDIDTSSVHRRGGDFIESELQAAAMTGDIVERAVSEIIAKGVDRKAWLVFCCGIEHAEAVASYIRDAGIECATIFGSTPKDERDAIIDRFKARQLRCIVNVNVLTTGFDAPHVDLIVLLRPTLSPGLYCQMVGRGLRLAEGKSDCLVLDFGGNIYRHGPIDAVEIVEKSGDGQPGEAPAKTCPECDEIVAAAARQCVACGYEFPEPEVTHDDRPAEIDILKGSSKPSIERMRVRDTTYATHTKKDRPDSMRVEYQIGLSWIKEWVCFQHEGFARQKAVRWWAQRGGQSPPPVSVDEALVRIECGEIRDPVEITVDLRKNFPQVLGARMDREPGEDDGDEDGGPANYEAPIPAGGYEVDYSDLPF